MLDSLLSTPSNIGHFVEKINDNFVQFWMILSRHQTTRDEVDIALNILQCPVNHESLQSLIDSTSTYGLKDSTEQVTRLPHDSLINGFR
jgi:exoribonuclease II